MLINGIKWQVVERELDGGVVVMEANQSITLPLSFSKFFVLIRHPAPPVRNSFHFKFQEVVESTCQYPLSK